MVRPRLNAPRSTAIVTVVTAMVAISGALTAQQPAQQPPPDALSPVRILVGKWRGTSEGQPGRATVEPEYTGLFGSRFIHARNRSTYAPQEKNPKGEVHEDMGIFSFDKARKQIVLRQFHVEGFVNQYVAEAPSKPNTMIFTTEAIENRISPAYCKYVYGSLRYWLGGPSRCSKVGVGSQRIDTGRSTLLPMRACCSDRSHPV